MLDHAQRGRRQRGGITLMPRCALNPRVTYRGITPMPKLAATTRRPHRSSTPPLDISSCNRRARRGALQHRTDPGQPDEFVLRGLFEVQFAVTLERMVRMDDQCEFVSAVQGASPMGYGRVTHNHKQSWQPG